MSLASRVRAALTPIVPQVEPSGYHGDALEYITFSTTELGALYAGSRPNAIRHLLRVYWYFPDMPEGAITETNPLEKKARIAEALFSLGGTWPSIEDLSDSEGGCFAYECEVFT